MKFSANCFTEAASRSASSCEAEFVWEIYPTVVKHDNYIVSTWGIVFDHFIPCSITSEIYLINQLSGCMLCNISELLFNKESDYRHFVANLFSFSIIFHLELARIINNNYHQFV
jgi:hypothetical protein